MEKLPLEILCNIFLHLNNNKKTFSIYNCLLVNRTWCICCIPLIWKNPFDNKYVQNQYIKKNYNKYNNIIEIYTDLLDYNTKILFNIDPSNKMHLFKYCDFMKELNFTQLYLVVSNWIINKHIISYKKKFYEKIDFEITNLKICNLAFELLKTFILKCENLSSLYIDTSYIGICMKNKFNTSILISNKLTNILFRLKKIYIGDLYNKMELICYIFNYCKIEEIIVIISDNEKSDSFQSLANLLCQHYSLKHFTCRYIGIYSHSKLNANCIIKSFLHAVNYNKSILSYVEFFRCNFINDIELLKLSCLIKIKLNLINCKIERNSLNQ